MMIGKIRTVNTGQLFFLNDLESTPGAKYTAHNYFVLSRGPSTTIQCMHCTSLTNKTRINEVPILCTNGKVGYIVPSKIYTRMGRDFTNDKYRGTLSGADAPEFIELLLDLYQDSLGLHPDKHDNVVRRYNEYCTEFFNQLGGYNDDGVANQPSEETGYNIVVPSEVIRQLQEPSSSAGTDSSETGNDDGENAFNKMLRHHPKYWETKDLENFLKIMDSHKHEPEFKMNFLGVSSPQSVHQKVYLARKELRSRRSASENFVAKFSD